MSELKELIESLESAIKWEKKQNPYDTDECSWFNQVGVLMSCEKAELILEYLEQLPNQQPNSQP